LDEPWTPTLVHNIKVDGSICESTSGVRQGQRFHAFVPFHGTSLALEGPVLIDKHGKRNCLAQIARQFNIKCITDIACLQYCFRSIRCGTCEECQGMTDAKAKLINRTYDLIWNLEDGRRVGSRGQ
jgi:hypothetical protein